MHGTSWELEEVRGNAVKTMLTLAAISTVASLQVFGKDRLIFWRESAAGGSSALVYLPWMCFVLCCSPGSAGALLDCVRWPSLHQKGEHMCSCVFCCNPGDRCGSSWVWN